MWATTSNGLQMVVGDYGIKLPITVIGTTITASDSLRLTFNNAITGVEVLVKDYDNIVENTVDLEFTEAESALFPVGVYSYSLDWYQDGNFMCNIIPVGILRVVSKE